MSGRLIRVAGAVAMLMAGLAPARPGGKVESVATALVVSVDVSQSVDDARFRLQMEGIAEALEDPGVVAAITGNPGGILFAMVTWADRAGMPVPWRRIASKADAAAAAAAVRATPRQAGEFTCIGQMFRTVAASVIPAMPLPADRIVVDVSGDGSDNCTDPDALEAERDAPAAGPDQPRAMVPRPCGGRPDLLPPGGGGLRRLLPGDAAEVCDRDQRVGAKGREIECQDSLSTRAGKGNGHRNPVENHGTRITASNPARRATM